MRGSVRDFGPVIEVWTAAASPPPCVHHAGGLPGQTTDFPGVVVARSDSESVGWRGHWVARWRRQTARSTETAESRDRCRPAVGWREPRLREIDPASIPRSDSLYGSYMVAPVHGISRGVRLRGVRSHWRFDGDPRGLFVFRIYVVVRSAVSKPFAKQSWQDNIVVASHHQNASVS